MRFCLAPIGFPRMVYEVTTGPRLASPVSTVVVETCHPQGDIVTIELSPPIRRDLSRGAVGRAQHKPERHRLGQRTSPGDYSDGPSLTRISRRTLPRWGSADIREELE